MRKREKEALQEVWKEMSTEKLDELLHMELQKELPDDDRVRGILSVLDERERDYANEITDEIQTAWDKYKSTMEAPEVREYEKPVRSRKWIVGVAAAAALLVVMFIPRTVGAESIFQVLYRWTTETFEFISPGEKVTNTNGEYVFQTDNTGLQQVYDKVVEMGVAEPVVPMWLPDGYELVELEASSRPGGEKLFAYFSRDNMLISLSYYVTGNEVSTQYEYEGDTVEKYEAGGTIHCVITNENNRTVAWENNGVECSIVLSATRDEIQKIINSVYKGGP